MYQSHRDLGMQRSSELIDIAAWESDGPPNTGASYRPKNRFLSPREPERGFVRPSYKHLWKLGITRAPYQFWNEILAYRLGLFLGIAVPPTYVAVNSITGQVGALSEFFTYGSETP